MDVPLGAMPFSIANLSITHHILVLGGLKSSELSASAGRSALWLLGLGLFWLVLGLWRLARSEFSSSEK
jgi:hypothetical protein